MLLTFNYFSSTANWKYLYLNSVSRRYVWDPKALFSVLKFLVFMLLFFYDVERRLFCFTFFKINKVTFYTVVLFGWLLRTISSNILISHNWGKTLVSLGVLKNVFFLIVLLSVVVIVFLSAGWQNVARV